MIQMVDMELGAAEFEATWLEVSYQEGRATVAQVEQAIQRVDELRRLARDLAHASDVCGGYPWYVAAPLAAAGH